MYLLSLAFSFAAAVGSASGISLVTQVTNIVDLGYAKYRGSFNASTNITDFLGIRYAAPPVGDLRWRAPTKPGNISGVQEAITQPNICYQAPSGTAVSKSGLKFAGDAKFSTLMDRQETSTESEDCLFLNVHVPGNLDLKKKLPVIVWIHGGGYISGDARSYNGGELIVESNHQLITVIIQYRLGLFGFLAGSAVAKNGNMNAGLLDQEFAFKWVQDHITKFGGDPGKVTIWGESAGGGSVLQHLISRDGQASPKLFRAGISSSSFLPSQYKFNDDIPEGLYTQAVSQANCAKKSDTLTCLRSADASTLANINVALNAAAFYGTYTLVPVVDEQFITQSPTQALKQGLTKGSALLSITNADEGFIFIDPNTNYTAAQYAKQLFPKLTNAEAQSVGEVYGDLGSKFNQSAKIMADAIFVCPKLFLQSSFSQSNKMTWAGQFAIPPALHVQDVFYYFKSVSFPQVPGLPPVFQADHFADSFAKSFFDFIISLDPNVKIDSTVKIPHWPTYGSNSGHPKEMYFGQTPDGQRADIKVIDVNNDLLERCKLWASLSNKIGQ